MQTPTMSFLEETIKRLVVLFIVAPLVSIYWLPYLGIPVEGWWHGVVISWPYVLAALVTGWAIRRVFNAI